MSKGVTVGVIGAGVIGGSIAKRAAREGYGVLVYDTDESILSDVIKSSAGFAHNLSALEKCDIIFISVPVSAFADAVESLKPYLHEGQIVSDVSSTKQSPAAVLATLETKVTVIGGHPLAGSAKSGWAFSDPDLFNECVWVLCPTDATSQVPIKFTQMLTDLGVGRILICTPEQHDRAVAAISHGVQIASTSIASAIMDVVGEDELPWILAAGGFRDTTRVAESTSSMWVPILIENGKYAKEVVDAEIVRLQRFSNALGSKDADEIRILIEDGRRARAKWTEVKESPSENFNRLEIIE